MIDNKRSADRGWLTPMSAALFLVAAIAWAVTAHHARSMVEMTGSMGMSLPSFIAMWSLMMAAMMFPSVAPLASRYMTMGFPDDMHYYMPVFDICAHMGPMGSSHRDRGASLGSKRAELIRAPIEWE